MTAGSRSREGRGSDILCPLALCLALVALLLAVPTTARALETETFRFEPHPPRVQNAPRRFFEFGIAPGQAVTDHVRVVNTSDQPRTFRLYGADAVKQPDGVVAVAPFGTEARAVGTWIRVEEEQLTLLPGTAATIAFTVHRPAGDGGEGMGAVVAEEVGTEGQGGIRMSYRLALLVYMDGEPSGLAVAAPDLRIPIGLVPSTGEASATVTNDTLQPVDTTVRFEVQSLTGRVWPLDPVEVRLDPGESRVVSQDWTTVPRWGGILQVQATAHWEAGSVSTTSPRRVYPPLWMLAVLIALTGVRGLRVMWDDRRRRPPGPPARHAGPLAPRHQDSPSEDREPALV